MQRAVRTMSVLAGVFLLSLYLFGCGSEQQKQPAPGEKVTLQREEKAPEMAVDTIAPALQPEQPKAVEEQPAEKAAEATAEKPKAESAEPQPTKPAKPLGSPANPLIGDVVDIAQVLTGGSGKLDRQQALKLVERGQPIGVLAHNTLYLVYHPDGSYAGKKLAKFAGAPVGIVGQIRSRGGWNVIIADMIESVR